MRVGQHRVRKPRNFGVAPESYRGSRARACSGSINGLFKINISPKINFRAFQELGIRMPTTKELVESLRRRVDHVPYGQDNEISKALGDLRSQRSDVSGGICFGLSCQWVELHRDYHSMGNGEKYRISCISSRIKDLASDSAYFYRAMNSQAEYMNNDGDAIQRMSETAKKYKLQLEAKVKHNNSEQLTRSVGITHSYHLITFGYGSGQHAICSYKSGGKIFGIGSHIYVFDANLGEFRVKSGEIVSFFQEYFNVYASQGPIKFRNSFRVAFR
jgi:hypothetical protein